MQTETVPTQTAGEDAAATLLLPVVAAAVQRCAQPRASRQCARVAPGYLFRPVHGPAHTAGALPAPAFAAATPGCGPAFVQRRAHTPARASTSSLRSSSGAARGAAGVDCSSCYEG